MKNIYFQNKKIIIEEDKSKPNPSAKEIEKYIDKINKKNAETDVIIHCASEEETLMMLFSYFKEIPAAGGVVMNNKKEILFIFRRGKWDLPKGKINSGESADVAAIREVKEECGLQNLKIIKNLPSTYHTYVEDEQIIIKETYWFLMTTPDNILIPQKEEDITKAEWKSKADKKEIFNSTFPSIQDVIKNIW